MLQVVRVMFPAINSSVSVEAYDSSQSTLNLEFQCKVSGLDKYNIVSDEVRSKANTSLEAWNQEKLTVPSVVS